MQVKKLPPPPKNLAKIDADYWKTLGTILVKRGTLEDGDLPALAMLCGACADVDRARATLVKVGLTAPTRHDSVKTHPASRILDTAQAQALRWLSHFGLTPASRRRASAATPPAPGDNLQEFL